MSGGVGSGPVVSERFGLAADMRAKLVSRFAARRGGDSREAAPPAPPPPLGNKEVQADLRLMRRAGEALGIDNPYFRPHAAIAGATTIIGNREYDNFVSYNYIGLNGDPRVSAAAKAAIDRYGTSVSASRIVSGERPVHRELELALAEAHGTADALALVSGHATNVTVIGHLVDRNDLILHDAFSHNSIVQGALLSGARRISFPHNDMAELDRMLGEARASATRALIVVEGHYSMDGDVPDLARVIAIARRHRASVMVDEAHSLGVLGAGGLGIAERCGVDPAQVDLWMGTLSKSLSSCGGYVAGSAELIDYLRCSAPGFVYSVGLPPPVAAAALAALQILRREPERVAKLAHNAAFFLARAREAGLDTGLSVGAAIVPIMTGSSIRAARAADHLFRAGINVQPIMYPAVQERAARLRFFISSLHSEAQLAHAAVQTAEALEKAGSEKVSMIDLAKMLGSG
jgi:8-amino-7-oxononanoate synthase